MQLDLLIKISIVLFTGILGGKIAKTIKIPNITGYLLGGLIVGPSIFNILTDIDVKSFSIINDIALAAIAFTIGSEFLIEELRKVGKRIFIITFSESFMTMLIVFLASYFIAGESVYLSLLLGAISGATAPAAVTMIIQQYKTSGDLTKTVLPVVAIDDALCVMGFGIAMAITKMSTSVADVSLLSMIIHPISEILFSIIAGIIVGIIMTALVNKSSHENEVLTLVLAFVIGSAGIANIFNLSPILMSMSVGATLTNLMQNYRKIFNAIGKFTPPIYLFFFTLAGASLHIESLKYLGLLGGVYVVGRSIGKISGATFGSKITNSPRSVVNNLGFALLPQAGVAIGLSMMVQQQMPAIGETVSTVVLGGVLIFEVIGPIMAKYAFNKAGEIH